jgi:hypothetical protein
VKQEASLINVEPLNLKFSSYADPWTDFLWQHCHLNYKRSADMCAGVRVGMSPEKEGYTRDSRSSLID